MTLQQQQQRENYKMLIENITSIDKALHWIQAMWWCYHIHTNTIGTHNWKPCYSRDKNLFCSLFNDIIRWQNFPHFVFVPFWVRYIKRTTTTTSTIIQQKSRHEKEEKKNTLPTKFPTSTILFLNNFIVLRIFGSNIRRYVRWCRATFFLILK